MPSDRQGRTPDLTRNSRPWPGPRINIQRGTGGKAKQYQVAQVLAAIERMEGGTVTFPAQTFPAQHYTYRVAWYEPDGEYVGTCVEFPGLSSLASTQDEALDGIRTTVTEVLEDMTTSGETVPQPLGERNFSGKFQVRISPSLHRKLARRAAEEGVSLNALVSETLAAI